MRLGVIADIHLAPSSTPPIRWHNLLRFDAARRMLEDAVAGCLAAGAELIAVPGDLSHFGDDASLDEAIALLAQSGLPVFIVAGNHDLLPNPAALAESIHRDRSGAVHLARPDGELLAPEIRLCGLDIRSADDADFQAVGAPPLDAWGDDLVLLLTHYPTLSLREPLDDGGLLDAGDLVDVEYVGATLLGRQHPIVVLNGHQHVRHVRSREFVLQLSLAALIELPYEYAVVDVRADSGTVGVEADFRSVCGDGEATGPVLAPERISATLTGTGGWRMRAGPRSER